MGEQTTRRVREFAPEQRDPYDERFMRDNDGGRVHGAPVKHMFHGGCAGCDQLYTESMDVCVQCCYHENKWHLPSKHSERPEPPCVEFVPF